MKLDCPRVFFTCTRACSCIVIVAVWAALRVVEAGGFGNEKAPTPQKCSFEFDLSNEAATPSASNEGALWYEQNATLLVGVGFLKTGTTRLSSCLRQLSATPAASFASTATSMVNDAAANRHRRTTVRTWCSPPVKEARFWHSPAVAPCVHPAGWVPASEVSVGDAAVRSVCGTDRLQVLRRQYLEKLGAFSSPEYSPHGNGAGRRCSVAWEFSPGTLQATPSTVCALRLLRHLFPTALVVVSLRDPVSRAHSQQNMWYSRRCLKTTPLAAEASRLQAAGEFGPRTNRTRVRVQGQATPSLARCAHLTANVQLKHELEFLQTAAACSELKTIATMERAVGNETNAVSVHQLSAATDAAFDALSQCGFALAQSIADHPALKGTCRAFPRPLTDGLASSTAAGSSSNRTQDLHSRELPNCPAPVLIQSHYSVFLNVLVSIFGPQNMVIVQGAASSTVAGQDSTALNGLESSIEGVTSTSRFARSFSNLVQFAEARGNHTPRLVVQHSQEPAMTHCVLSGTIGASAYLNNGLSSELRQALEAYFATLNTDVSTIVDKIERAHVGETN
eukprot:INCI17685.1.p1 GENE.INCI17685.1~~INCI17685.1.p1  ORF type:complete len:564 (+),score=72.16 INCI17685.1:292-1983(+)